ncbi:MAG: 16S rRNA (adenine(1518)-N(6)/adenine(1519)-N(6))-dimethyltransferase RsmA [Saprospiraceae bacterium]|nr:16S rRNA (adenine(1518)-N(6)/adenine(1519)-N(6))-dimethyltransferase RsmA [Saprospiraceae bacterium]
MRAKKSYGQHFLKHDSIAARIADAMQLATQTGRVLEIGPGMGMLTKHLLANPEYQTWAVEADRDMVAHLEAEYPALHGRLYTGDYLQFDAAAFMGPEPYVLIGNFPYNISTQILFKLLDERVQIPEMVGMFQKEVADRVVSPPGSKTYGITSVLLQASFHCEYLFTVERGSFNPPPQVLSAVIRLTRKEEHRLPCDEARFRTLVKTVFNQRRKMMRNTLKPFFPNERLMSDPFFEKRPETLGWQEFVELTNRSAGE